MFMLKYIVHKLVSGWFDLRVPHMSQQPRQCTENMAHVWVNEKETVYRKCCQFKD